jgi:hypothetical protein
MEQILKVMTLVLMIGSFFMAGAALLLELDRFVLVLSLMTFGLAALLVPLIEEKWGWQKKR